MGIYWPTPPGAAPVAAPPTLFHACTRALAFSLALMRKWFLPQVGLRPRGGSGPKWREEEWEASALRSPGRNPYLLLSSPTFFVQPNDPGASSIPICRRACRSARRPRCCGSDHCSAWLASGAVCQKPSRLLRGRLVMRTIRVVQRISGSGLMLPPSLRASEYFDDILRAPC